MKIKKIKIYTDKILEDKVFKKDFELKYKKLALLKGSLSEAEHKKSLKIIQEGRSKWR